MRLLEQLATLTSPKGWWTGQRPPRFYSYHPETFEYLGAGECDPSPLEEGIWLQPGHSTLEAIPDRCPAGYSLVHEVDGNWRPWRDRRGEVVYDGGEFRTISTLGEHPGLKLEVHDAQYMLDDLTDDEPGRIRMWVNDDVIEFVDAPHSIQRQVLAQWEALGETIRPADADIETVAERDEREAAEQAEIDAAAAAVVEGKPQSEETPNHV